jgi:hypothetical protein
MMATTTTTSAEGTPRTPDERVPGPRRPLSEDASPWRATGREAPVFFDERGRRGLLVRVLGLFGAFVSTGALTAIVIGALAFVRVSPLPAGGHGIFSAHLAGHPRSSRGATGAWPVSWTIQRLDLRAQGARSALVADKRDEQGKSPRA